ncbi:inositol-tetrakisphosphate 1-kinase-like [Convolutriloba macropyga]|uniref:inositol-tetrakisphosphate 1-kinase-like n=1 Tax=Convolutriloba macropyga TaxID=536237 RepID=UPI003F524EE1
MVENVIKIGFWIRDGKWEKLQLDRLTETQIGRIETKTKHSVVAVKISKAEDLDSCNVVFIKRRHENSSNSDSILERLESIPEIVQLDSIFHQTVLFNRELTFQKLQSLSNQLQPLNIMSSFSLDHWTCIDKVMEQNPVLKFPFICKPNTLLGNDQDHQMLIVYNVSQLRELNVKNYLFQPLIRHKGLLKTFVIGNEFYVAVRPSINKIVYQDRCKGFNTFIVKTLEAASDEIISELKLSVDRQTFHNMTHVLGSAFNLSLYGVDIVIDENGSPFIIDFNIFPGYAEMISAKGIEHVHEAFMNLAIEKLNSRHVSDQRFSTNLPRSR